MTSARVAVWGALTGALLIVMGCGVRPQPSPAVAGKHVDPGTAGSINGRITFRGKAPKAEVIRMSADPACEQVSTGRATTETALVGADGALANVFVHIEDAFTGYEFDVPKEAVVLDQRGCRYVPHVLGVRVGQPLEFLNSDETFHNAHASPAHNTEFDRGEPTAGMRLRHTFTKPEVMVPIKCNVHNWMKSYVGVMAHPYFAVTAADGAFAMNGLPPGTYRIDAWHELFGEQSQSVTITEKQTVSAAFTFQSK